MQVLKVRYIDRQPMQGSNRRLISEAHTWLEGALSVVDLRR